jgi:hypothetical protein
VSKKSKPGDGSEGCGVKGGGLYGAHFAVADEQQSAARPIRSVLNLMRFLRTSHTA